MYNTQGTLLAKVICRPYARAVVATPVPCTRLGAPPALPTTTAVVPPTSPMAIDVEASACGPSVDHAPEQSGGDAGETKLPPLSPRPSQMANGGAAHHDAIMGAERSPD